MPDAQVRLRPITEADLPDYVEWLNDPEVTQFTSFEAGSVTIGGQRKWLVHISAPECRERHWAIEAEGRHIGSCGLVPDRDPTVAKAGLGIIIGDKTAWGHGYGPAALRELLRIGFEEMDLHRVHLAVCSEHCRAIRCYTKCGFRQEGFERQSHFKGGTWHDLITMAMLREEWEARASGLTPGVEWQNCLDALSPRPGEVIVDAGCGDGLPALFIASRVAPSGRVIGIEVNEEKAEKAIERIAARGMQAIASVQRGDIRSLPLPDDSVDAWLCRETLEYLEDPTAALSEAIRVVRPGGRVVAHEADWDTLAYNASDKAAERKFVAVHTDCGGGGSIDGRMGRRLLSLFREAGLADVRLEVHTRWSDKYSPNQDYVCWPLREGHVRRGCITQEELDAWYADMSAQAQRGRYFHCFSYFICLGRVT